MQAILKMVTDRQNLTYQDARFAMNKIMSGEVSDIVLASYLTALKLKGETSDEILGSAMAMRDKAVKIKGGNSLDIVGTGGDGHNTFNVSSISALVAAGCGIKVAKHGNKSVSSKCGSADVFEALGVKIDIPPQRTQEIFDKIGIAFLFAPVYHTSMKYAAGVRKELGFRSIFNILGPLSNPASANYALLGVYDRALQRPVAEALGKLGLVCGIVVHGENGLDEVNPSGVTYVSEFKDGNVVHYTLTPKDFGLEGCALQDIIGGDVQTNKQIALRVLQGEKGPLRDTVIMNSALALKAVLSKPIIECAQMAAKSIDSGTAIQKLEELIIETNK
ncbi:MAG TPA: anthranilate phosphoribosyltransferase [Clostridiales bacterium]|jgi:anthranilate phosphoribosyltransferase|nr:anthranilate phosphoribosyltransferase [Clostridiales bacterium]